MNKCLICGRPLVEPTGPPASPWGIIGEYPGDEENKELRPFVGPSGQVLRTELYRAGFDPEACRMVNLWSHDPSENERDYLWNLQRALASVQGCTFVLLLGSQITQAILGRVVSDVAGLVLASEVLPGKKIIAAPNPAGVMRGTLGEFRRALEVLKQETAKWVKSSARKKARPRTSSSTPTKQNSKASGATSRSRTGSAASLKKSGNSLRRSTGKASTRRKRN